MSFRKSVVAAFAAAAAAGAVLLVKSLKDEKDEKPEEEKSGEDNDVHFIKIDEEPDKPAFDLEGKSDEVKEIAGVYPYLNPDFIEEMLGKNDELNGQYEAESLVNISHYLDFPDAETMEKAMDILDESGYICTQLGETNFSASKRLYQENSALVSDVLNVANQTAALNGTYQKYDVYKA